MTENDMNNAFAAYNQSMGELTQTIQNLNTLDRNDKSASEQRDWAEAMYDKQNAWNYERWKEQNEYNTPANQVARLREAGLNPLFYGLDGSSAGQVPAAQMLSYERANAENRPNPISVGSQVLQNSIQAKSIAKDIELKNAQIDSIKANTKGTELDNQFKDLTMEARVESEKLSNSLTKKQIDEAASRIDKNRQDIQESIARTENEIEKKGLIIAEKALTDAKTKEILELLPYQKLLMQAQTEAQKASAAASFAKAAIDRKLLNEGYYDSIIAEQLDKARQAKGLADDAQWKARMDEMKTALKEGHAFHSDNKVMQFIYDNTANAMFMLISKFSDAGLSGLSGLIGG